MPSRTDTTDRRIADLEARLTAAVRVANEALLTAGQNRDVANLALDVKNALVGTGR